MSFKVDKLYLIGKRTANIACLEDELAANLEKGDVILGRVLLQPKNYEFLKNLQPEDYKQLMIMFQCVVAEIRK